MNNNVNRPMGVLGNTPVPTHTAPMKVGHAMPAQFYAVSYGDAQGVEHTMLVLKVGDQWYMPPDSESYAAKLRPCTKWLVEELNRKAVSATPVSLPTKDEVEVLP